MTDSADSDHCIAFTVYDDQSEDSDNAVFAVDVDFTHGDDCSGLEGKADFAE